MRLLLLPFRDASADFSSSLRCSASLNKPLVYLNEHVFFLLALSAGMGYLSGFCTYGQSCVLYNGNTNAHFLAGLIISL